MDALNRILTIDGAKIVGEYSEVSRKKEIQYLPKCEKKVYKKTFRSIHETGAICDNKLCCTINKKERINQIENIKKELGSNKQTPIKYTQKLLVETFKRDHGVILGEYKKLNRDYEITGKCKCGKNFTKCFRNIVENSGAFCDVCSEKNHRIKIEETTFKNHGVRNALESPEIRQKANNTIKERYGVDNISQLEEIKKQKEETCLKNNGVRHPFQSPDIRERSKQTNVEHRGVEFPTQCPLVQAKIKEANQLNLGVDWPQQSLICQKKSQETSIEHYGVPHACQSPEFFEQLQKRAFSSKEYVMPSGDIRIVQGFEPNALDILIKIYNEEQIKTGVTNNPIIHYKSEDGKDHKYYPDIWIPHENKLIEAKSTWTYSCKTDNIQIKAEATKAAGFNYEIWIFDGKGHRVVQ